jgi:hypothetical protein
MVNLERLTEKDRRIRLQNDKAGLAEIHPWRFFAGSEKFDFAVFGSSVRIPIARELLWGRSVTTIQAVIFGMMLSWTPSAVLLAILLWNDPRDPVDQP